MPTVRKKSKAAAKPAGVDVQPKKRRGRARKNRTTENAVITGTFLGPDGNEYMTFWLLLRYEGGRAQKFGDIQLDIKGGDLGLASVFIRAICDVFGVKAGAGFLLGLPVPTGNELAR